MRRRKFKIQQLTEREYDLLKVGYFLHYNNPESFTCYGYSFEKLLELELIDKENQITYTGRQLVKYLMANMT